jgi:hypothetical protein
MFLGEGTRFSRRSIVKKATLKVSLALIAITAVGCFFAQTASAAPASNSDSSVSAASLDFARELSQAFPALARAAGGKALKGEDKSEMALSAATVCFAKELGLSFPSLSTLGVRIEEAKKQADPVGLAVCARELMAAEKASGKFAAIKSEKLMKEAIDLVKLRSNSAELKAVAELAGQASKKELMGQAVKAEELESQAKLDKETGKTRGITGPLHIDSRVNVQISAYVNGTYVGTMNAFGDIFTNCVDPPGATNTTTTLFASCGDGRTWSRTVTGRFSSYHWILL